MVEEVKNEKIKKEKIEIEEQIATFGSWAKEQKYEGVENTLNNQIENCIWVLSRYISSALTLFFFLIKLMKTKYLFEHF